MTEAIADGVELDQVLRKRGEFGADVLGVGVAELVEDGQGLLRPAGSG